MNRNEYKSQTQHCPADASGSWQNGHSGPANLLLDAVSNRRVALFTVLAVLFGFLLRPTLRAQPPQAESNLAIVEAGVQEAEDAPFVPKNYRFLPGEYLFFAFKIAGFQVESSGTDLRRISLSYEVTAEDAKGVALAPAATGAIKEDLSAEDKNWIPARRISLPLPSFVAAGVYHVHVSIKDVFAKSGTSRDFPFLIGGTELTPATGIAVQNVQFLRSEEAREPLQLPAYRPGDPVFVRFVMTGFKTDAKNMYHLAYALKVLRPDGKVYFEDPHAAELSSQSFYPAQFIPGNVAINTSSDSSAGQYTVILSVRDVLANQTSESRTTFQIE